MIAALPMYDAGRAREANDALWRVWSQALAARGVSAPDSLYRSGVLEDVWRDPQLLVGQTCSLPWVVFLEHSTRIFAIPQYSAPDCGKATYRSLLIVRKDALGDDLAAFAGATVAVNGARSQSGHTSLAMALERRELAMPFFARARETGSHMASLQMLAEGAADVAAIDCVTFAHWEAGGNPHVDAVRVIGRSPQAPAPPFITSRSREPAMDAILLETLCETIADPAAKPICEALLLEGVVPPDRVLGAGLDAVRAAWCGVGNNGIAREWEPLEQGP